MRTTPAPNIDIGRPEIERAIRFLEREGDVQGVIRLVEAWERGGEVSLLGLLAQARAFLRLCLMDRAWVRLREASQQAPEDVEVLVLTARVFLARGWPARAQRLLEQVQTLAPDHPELEVLRARTAEPPPAPPPNARELERSTDPRQLLALTESYLASGSFLRARSLLERTKRLDPHNYRVDLLLWGVQGDFLPKGRSLADLVREAAEPGEWEAAEHTVSARVSELGLADPPTAEISRDENGTSASGLAFPDLFRGGPGERRRKAPVEDEEVTAAIGLASPEEMQQPPEAELTDSGASYEDLGGDTQIMQVIRKPGGAVGLASVEGGIHQPVPGTEAPRDPLDLRAWQRSMGMASPAAEEPLREDGDYLEAEDEDLVVLTRREEGEVEPAPPAPPREGPIEVIEKRPTPNPPVADPFHEVETHILPQPEPAAMGKRLGLLVLVALLLMVVMGLTAWLTVRVLRDRQERVELGLLEQRIERGDRQAVAELEASLTAELERPPEGRGTSELSLALARIRLWEELEGGLAWRAGASEAIGLAAERGAPELELAQIEARFLVADGRAGQAAARLEEAGPLAEPRLRARIALERGDGPLALSSWTPSPDELAVPRWALLYRRVLLQAGDEAGAAALGQRLLQEHGDDPAIRLASLLEGFGSADDQARAPLLQQDAHELGSRQQAQLLAHRAAQLDQQGELDEALALWRAALAIDSGLESALYRLAGQSSAENGSLVALGMLERCALGRSGSVPCARGRIHVLLDLDRVDEARTVLEEMEQPPVALQAWVALQAEDGAGALARLPELTEVAQRPEDGLSAYVLGRVLAAQGERERAQRTLWAAVQTLSLSPDPFDRILAGRAAVERLALAPDSLLDVHAREVLALAPSDPVVLVGVAERLERAGRSTPARQHLARAVAMAPESSLAWYALSNSPEGDGAVNRYLALTPSGPRAERVRQALP